MAKRPTLPTVTSTYLSSTSVDDAFRAIETAFDNTLSRDGSTPNTMSANLDMNSNDILNADTIYANDVVVDGQSLGALTTSAAEAEAFATAASASASAASASASSASSSLSQVQSIQNNLPDWRGAWVTATAYGLGDLVRQSGTAYICIVAHTSGVFATDLAALRWEIFAEKGAAGAGSGDMLAANNLSDVANAATARGNLGLGSIATQASSSVTITGGSITGITDLAVADGGTGASNASGARTNLGLVIGTDVQAYDADLAAIAALADPNADRILFWDDSAGAYAYLSVGTGLTITGTTMTSSSSYAFTADTPVNTTSGTAITLSSSVPATATELIIDLNGVGLTGSDQMLIRLGDAGGFEATGYVSSSFVGSGADTSNTTGFVIIASGGVVSGPIKLYLTGTNTWSCNYSLYQSVGNGSTGGGRKALSDTLTSVQITRTGSNTFNAGSATVLWR